MRDGYEYIESTYSLKALTEFIGEHPEFMSVVSFNVNNPDSGIYYQPDVPRTMGTLASIFVLIEYERQVAEGLINPADVISKEEIEWLVLPDLSEEAHISAMEILTEESNSFTFDEAIVAMVEYNDIAIHDYFWLKLGKENLESLMDSLGLTSTETPLPFSGLYLSVHPEFSDTSRGYSDEEVIDLATRFQSQKEFNQEVKEIFEENRLGLTFIQERDALQYFPHTTAREIAGLMARLYKDDVLSPEVSQAVKEKLGWVFEGEAITRSFSEYGAIYDNRMGILSGIDFGTSIYDGHASAQAVFFDKLPVAFWLHLSSNHMQEDYQQRLIWDPALFETTKQQITN